MIASTSQHLHRLVQRVEQLTAQSALQRVAEFLASLCLCKDGPCTISLPYDKSLIAGRLGLQPESLSRAFAKLRLVGVNVRTSDVVVSDVARLRGVIASDRIGARGMSFSPVLTGVGPGDASVHLKRNWHHFRSEHRKPTSFRYVHARNDLILGNMLARHCAVPCCFSTISSYETTSHSGTPSLRCKLFL